MKKTIKIILTATALSVMLIVLTYFAFTFGAWEFNPGRWSDPIRSLVAMMFVFEVAGTILASSMIHNPIT